MSKPRYIDANNIKLTGLTFNDVNNEVYFSLTDVRKAIEQTPTEDVEEVRHGYWYRHDKKKHGDTCYYCSECEKMALSDFMMWELMDYCPHCGAKMDGERKEQG